MVQDHAACLTSPAPLLHTDTSAVNISTMTMVLSSSLARIELLRLVANFDALAPRHMVRHHHQGTAEQAGQEGNEPAQPMFTIKFNSMHREGVAADEGERAACWHACTPSIITFTVHGANRGSWRHWRKGGCGL